MGAEVYGYALAPNTNPSHFELLGGNKEFRGVFADIRDRENLKQSLRSFNPDIIFHLAAQPLVRESYKNPVATFESNVIGTLNVLDCARELESLKAIVVITTDKVYENKEWIWGYRENDALGGYDPYSASKACAEIVTDSMRNSFFNINEFGKSHQVLIATARAGNVIGGGDWSEDRLIPDIIKAVCANKSVKIRNPKSTRPWQHVLEPLRGYLMLGEKLLEGKKEFATAFNFGPNLQDNLRVEEILKITKNLWDKVDYVLECDSNAPHEAGLLMLDVAKAQKLLNWEPVMNSLESIKYTISWYREFYENGQIVSQEQLGNYIKEMK